MRRNARSSQRQKHCTFCAARMDSVEYKAVDLMKPLMNERGKIVPRRKTGTCARHQRHLTTAVKRARHLALLPYEIQ